MKTIYDQRYRKVINRIKSQRLASGINQKKAGLAAGFLAKRTLNIWDLQETCETGMGR